MTCWGEENLWVLRRGIEPIATLYHWDLPEALEQQGGWLQRGTVDAFAAYASLCFQRLGKYVKLGEISMKSWRFPAISKRKRKMLTVRFWFGGAALFMNIPSPHRYNFNIL